jgi:hypothetical protein
MKAGTTMRTLALVLAAAVASPAAAQSVAGAFAQGRTHVMVTAGSGAAFDESYLVLGLGASYYLIDGLSVGLFLESWTGGDPGLVKYTGSLQYVFHKGAAKPYLGTFYRRTDIEDRADLDSVGARAGIYFAVSQNAYLGFGGVYEKYLDCNKTTYRSCDGTYGEVTVTFAF